MGVVGVGKGGQVFEGGLSGLGGQGGVCGLGWLGWPDGSITSTLESDS